MTFAFWLYLWSCHLCSFFFPSKRGCLEKEAPSKESKSLGMIFVAPCKKDHKFSSLPVPVPTVGLFHSESRLGYLTNLSQWDSDKCDAGRDSKCASILAAVGILWAPCGMPELANCGMKDMRPCDPRYSLPMASKFDTGEWGHLGHSAARRFVCKVVLYIQGKTAVLWH